MADYRFSSPYRFLFGGYSNDYRIEILPLQSDTPRIGDSLSFDLDYWVDPNVIGANTPTESITWTDHGGNVLGTSSTLIYQPPTSGWYSIEVTVVLEDIPNSFEYTISEGYTFNLLALVDLSVSFGFKYEAESTNLIYSNMDMYRFLTYFPKWSSSYINHFSNTSKFISPQLERISGMMNNLDEFLANNNIHNDNTSFEYKKNTIRILTVNTPDNIKTEYGYLVNLGEESTTSINNMNIEVIENNITFNIDKVSIDVFGGKHRIVFKTPSVVYFKSLTFPESKDKRIVVSGISIDGDFITENIILKTSIPVQSINEFLVINRVICEDIEINVSNYIESDISYTDRTLLSKRIVGKNGIYFTPEFIVEDTILLIMNGDEVSKREEFKFELPFIPDTILIDNLLDVFMLKDNIVYTSKLMLDNLNITSPGSSVNNNTYIVVDDENASVGTSTNVSINTEQLKNESNTSHIRISILNQGVKNYLTQSGTLTLLKDTWIEMGKTGNRIIIAMNILNSDDYVLELEENTRVESYHAMIYQNKIIPTIVAKDIDSIFFHNKNLYMQDINTVSYLSTPIRMGFTTEGRYSYLQYDFEKTELIYND
ncbi:hypothetical protein N9242_00970 [Vicingaceae bacterium]|nr:hypothetical protein [Vicingaceae bacterium]